MIDAEHAPIPEQLADNPELSETQKQWSDAVKSVNKVVLATSTTEIQFMQEKSGGLKRLMDAVKNEQERLERPLTPDEFKELEDEVRYHPSQPVAIGNTTELLRMCLGYLHQNKNFAELSKKMIDETMEAVNKQSQNRLSFRPEGNKFGT